MAATAIIVLRLTFNLLGQCSLLIVLGVVLFSTTLPQRNNPFLINVLLATYLSTFPPCLLFFAGQQGNNKPPTWLCATQSVLMDGMAPLIWMALVILVFVTWRDIGSKFGTNQIVTKTSYFTYLLLLLPYVTMSSWCIISAVVGWWDSAGFHYTDLGFCLNHSVSGKRLGRISCTFVMGLSLIGFYFGFRLGCLIWRTRMAVRDTLPEESSFASYNLGLRVLTFFTMITLTVMCLSISSFVEHMSPRWHKADRVLRSLNPLWTFLVFGTQKAIWRVIFFCQRKRDPDQISEELDKHKYLG